MNDWNVVVTVHERNLAAALDVLREYGDAARTEYFNVAVMKVADPLLFMESLRKRISSDPGLLGVLARVVPALHGFNFQSPEDFEQKAKKVLGGWAARLGGRRFHVRMHRRGFKGRLSSLEEERLLDGFLLEELDGMQSTGSIDFADPDMIIAIETIGQRAGLSLWTRAELARYPLLGLD
ncbi:MAG: THUMP domain-containing protein [Desulfobulbaceae bacterium]|nr:THUMP domain-containing protein [Desulfobulbaceae bacterium]